jgi:hypothetical protein
MDKSLLAILCLLTAPLAGCLGAGAAPEASAPAPGPAAAPPAENGTAPAPAEAPAAPAQPKGCEEDTNANNYGTWMQVGDLYVLSPFDGKLAVVYRETNGVRGPQTESMCPGNPDLKLAEVPSVGPAPGNA